MVDWVDRVVGGVQDFFQDMSVNVREERVLRYIITELHKGRDFDNIMSDPYVVNNTKTEDRVRMMENPETLRGIEAMIEKEFSDFRESVEAEGKD
jgi:hypothetical protein